ncbi:CAP domain-containing protein [Streptosporangium sp. NPDC051023]|uniref:CAP domain-containing protein n=1 Tax=Streptosporangium sp. NPDC051023 TaxID=3155410 RepID=UPI003450768C
MRRPLGVLACLGSLAALSAPTAAAQAATQQSPQSECRVYAANPYVTATGKIQASAARLGCSDTALVRIRILRAVTGPDPVVKSAARRGSNGRVTAALRCAPGSYYATVTDYQGNTGRSKTVRLSCSPTDTPTPSPTATSTTTPTPTNTAPAPAPPQGSSAQDEVVRLTNVERQAGGCAPLKNDPQLRSAAQGHSDDMAAKNYFSHTSQDGRTMTDRIKASGFSPMTAWAENIAWGQRTPADVVKAWMNSEGHRRNIMNCAYTHIGVGMATSSRGPYWTQDFAKH